MPKFAAHNVKSIDVHGPIAYGEFVECRRWFRRRNAADATAKDGKANDKQRPKSPCS